MRLKTFRIELDGNDLGQLCDGLEMRIKAWEDTAHYMETGHARDEHSVIEECSDAEEARKIAAQYQSILTAIRKQVRAQGGF